MIKIKASSVKQPWSNLIPLLSKSKKTEWVLVPKSKNDPAALVSSNLSSIISMPLSQPYTVFVNVICFISFHVFVCIGNSCQIVFQNIQMSHSLPIKDNIQHLARSEPQKGNTTNHINHLLISIWVRVMVFNATFNNISVIYTAETPRWSSVLLLEETGVPGENHPPVVSH